MIVMLTLMLSGIATFGQAQAQLADAEAAMAKRNDCFKCHAVEKPKKDPSYKSVAARMRLKSDGMAITLPAAAWSNWKTAAKRSTR